MLVKRLDLDVGYKRELDHGGDDGGVASTDGGEIAQKMNRKLSFWHTQYAYLFFYI